MSDHLLPKRAWSSTTSRSSSSEKVPFLRSGRRWFSQRRRQLLPLLGTPVRSLTRFQSPSPCSLTYCTSISSSTGVHGPFVSSPPAGRSLFGIGTQRSGMLEKKERREGRETNRVMETKTAKRESTWIGLI